MVQLLSPSLVICVIVVDIKHKIALSIYINFQLIIVYKDIQIGDVVKHLPD